MAKQHEQFNHSCVFCRTWYSALTWDILHGHIFCGRWKHARDVRKRAMRSGKEGVQWGWARVWARGWERVYGRSTRKHLYLLPPGEWFPFVFLLPRRISWTLPGIPNGFVPFLGIVQIPYYLKKFLYDFEVLSIASCFHGLLLLASNRYNILVPSTPIRIA